MLLVPVAEARKPAASWSIMLYSQCCLYDSILEVKSVWQLWQFFLHVPPLCRVLNYACFFFFPGRSVLVRKIKNSWNWLFHLFWVKSALEMFYFSAFIFFVYSECKIWSEKEKEGKSIDSLKCWVLSLENEAIEFSLFTGLYYSIVWCLKFNNFN